METALVQWLPRRSGNAVCIIDSIRCGAGILMRCVSGSTGRPLIYGALWITKAKWERGLSRNGGIAGLRVSA